MTNSSAIAVGGENLIDYMTRDGEVTALPGGSPFNVAMALGRQGANVHYVSPISTDAWGDDLAKTLEGSDVILASARVDAPTTMARVTVTDGIPDYLFEREGTAERAVTVESLAATLPDDLKALHTGSLAVSEGDDAAAWETTCANTYQAGTLVSLDPNVRLSVIQDSDSYRDRVFRIMTAVHLMKFSDEDLEGLYPDATQADALVKIREQTSAILLVMTKGPDGACAWIGDVFVEIDAPPVPNLIDTVGAGDTFMATLLAGLDRRNALTPDAIGGLSEADVTALLQEAAMAAAINCGRAGCNPPTLDELKSALN